MGGVGVAVQAEVFGVAGAGGLEVPEAVPALGEAELVEGSTAEGSWGELGEEGEGDDQRARFRRRIKTLEICIVSPFSKDILRYILCQGGFARGRLVVCVQIPVFYLYSVHCG